MSLDPYKEPCPLTGVPHRWTWVPTSSVDWVMPLTEVQVCQDCHKEMSEVEEDPPPP